MFTEDVTELDLRCLVEGLGVRVVGFRQALMMQPCQSTTNSLEVIYWWAWVSVGMRSELGTHRRLEIQEQHARLGLWRRRKGAATECLDLSVSDMSCWVGVKVESKAQMLGFVQQKMLS